MLLEIILSLFLGLLAGTFTGLTPGIHINLIGALIVSLSTSVIYFISPIYLITFITSMAITHTFLDFIPSIFLGCPDTDTELSILPGHKLLKLGLGYEAILLTAYGSISAIFILIIIAFPSILLISKTYFLIKKILPYLLLFILFLLILLEKKNKKLLAIWIILLTGILGWSILNISPKILTQPLLPLLSGLFGTSTIIISLKNKTKIPKQKITSPKMIFKPLLGSLIASPICSFLPGLGSGQAAIIGNSLIKTNNKGFLILIGATNTLVMGFSFISLYLLSKTRTGATVAIKEIIGSPTSKILFLILIIVIFSGILSFFLTKFITKFLSQKFEKIDYSKISIFILIFLIILVGIVSKPFGILILLISTLTGIYSISLEVKRTNMMGCLLLPTILFYLL